MNITTRVNAGGWFIHTGGNIMKKLVVWLMLAVMFCAAITVGC